MAIKGADTSQLRDLAKQFQSRADFLQSDVVQTLGRQILSSPWKGTNADEFRNLWQRQYAPSIREVASRLVEGAELLERNARAQDDTSAADSTSDGGALPPGVLAMAGVGVVPTAVLPAAGQDGEPWWSRKDRRSARDGRRGGDSEPVGGSNPNDTTGGLGTGVPGEKAPIPTVEPWTYPGDTEAEGSGQHGQRGPGLGDYVTHEAATAAAEVMKGKWPDASKNLLHFLDNSGEPQDINVDQMLTDLPGLNNAVSQNVTAKAEEAVAAAQQSGATGPMTYPFTTGWQGYYAGPSESQNWFYATGGFQHNTAGTVTVYPPSADNPEWTYSYDYQVNVADRYNWDGTKSTQIGPFTVTDASLQELHRAGIAQEYDLVGDSEVMSGP